MTNVWYVKALPVEDYSLHYRFESCPDYKHIKYKIMGFFSSIITATVKTVLTPVAIVKDVVNVATGEEVNATTKLISSAAEDLSDAVDDITGG